MWLFIVWLSVAIILVLRNNYDKNVKLMLIFFLAIIFAAVYGNADTESYLLEYTNMTKPNWTDTEPLWMLIQYGMNFIHIPFVIFRLIIFLTGAYLIDRTIEEITHDKNIIWLVYMIYPFMLDIVQIRNFFAMAIFLYSLRFLFEHNKVGNVKYLICILVASLIHNVFVIYFVLILIKYIDYRIFLSGVLLGFVTLIYLMEKIPIIAMFFFSNYHGGNYARKYITAGNVSHQMIAALVVFYGLCAVCSIMIHRGFYLQYIEKKIDYVYFEKVDTLVKILMVLCCGFILNMFSMDLARVFRNVLIVFYALMWEYSKKKKHKYLIKMMLFFIALYGCWLFIYVSYPDTVFWPTFHNNYFFEWFNFS